MTMTSDTVRLDPGSEATPGAATTGSAEPLPRCGGRAGPRIQVLDGLRLLAALMVVAYHYTYRAPDAWGARATTVFPRLSTVTGYGWLGVELFFVISGFVICMSAWGRGVGDFFVARVVRLFPAYWFAVAATSTAVILVSGVDRARVTEIMVNLTMLQVPMRVPSIDGVYWTLWTELHFYLLFALVVWRGVSYRNTVLFCLLWTVASVAVTGSDDRVVVLVVGGAESSYFVAGIAFYLMYRFRPTLLLWGIVGVSLVLSLYRIGPTATAVDVIGARHLPWPATAGVVVGIFAVMAAVAMRWLSGIRWPWLTVAGALTYPLYLLHQQIGWFAIMTMRDRVPRVALLVAVVGAMLLAAWLVHRFVERPVAALGRAGLRRSLADLRCYPRQDR